MYNRILNRPMFKLGGDIINAKGTGITSGLDTPRQPYVFGEEVEKVSETIQVTPEQRRSNAMDAIASGFLHPDARTMGEALYHTNIARKSGIEPLESSVAERKFELSKIPLKTRGAMLSIPETATQTRAKILSGALKEKNDWEIANPDKDFRQSDGYGDWEFQIIQATNGKITTKSEARQTAVEILMMDDGFAKRWGMYQYLPEADKKKIDADIKRLVDFFMGVALNRIGKARGGRAGYQLGVGPNVMEEQVTDTLQMPGETVQATEQVEEVLPKSGTPSMEGEDPYKLLRARLPQEITDDVVRLIAYNPEAFKDFAGIESQEDVMLFNQKYGVELVLPTEQA